MIGQCMPGQVQEVNNFFNDNLFFFMAVNILT